MCALLKNIKFEEAVQMVSLAANEQLCIPECVRVEFVRNNHSILQLT